MTNSATRRWFLQNPRCTKECFQDFQGPTVCHSCTPSNFGSCGSLGQRNGYPMHPNDCLRVSRLRSSRARGRTEQSPTTHHPQPTTKHSTPATYHSPTTVPTTVSVQYHINITSTLPPSPPSPLLTAATTSTGTSTNTIIIIVVLVVVIIIIIFITIINIVIPNRIPS